ncbi:hypothetical protein [Azospirillum sp. Sh1]|uniref:hypothetical protein n=1 Tax=Azospirillum sp. Sh1 TaxID=2607285 RepID=UPI0011ED42E6|nr:hypothetical protein [Azospirillum sp. Sh1]KAA0572598.1 hypothetical protein FZ029_23210 [Azospirillum sp. Sh1]
MPIRIIVVSILVISLFATKPMRNDHINYVMSSNKEINNQKEKFDTQIKYTDLFLFTTMSYKCGNIGETRIVIDSKGHGTTITFGEKNFYFDEKLNKLSFVCSGVFRKFLTIGIFGKIQEMPQFDEILALAML